MVFIRKWAINEKLIVVFVVLVHEITLKRLKVNFTFIVMWVKMRYDILAQM